MSCACENKRLGQERERIRRLAKSFAMMEDATVVLYRKPDGTYGFGSQDDVANNEIVEYITPY